MTNEHITTTNELNTINSTLDLSENDAAELDKLNNVDLLNDSTLNQLNLVTANNNNSQEITSACTSSTTNTMTHHQLELDPDSPISIIKTINLNKPLVVSSRRAANRRNTTTEAAAANTENKSITTTVKEEPIVVIDDKDNSSLIDLTKENDDIMILSAEESGLAGISTIRNRSNRSNRLLSRRIASAANAAAAANNNNINTSIEIVPTTSASSSSIVDSVTVSELNNDMDIIQEVISTESSYKYSRPYVEFTYRLCRNNNNINNNLRNIITNSHTLSRQNRTVQNSLNSTIVLDDDSRNDSPSTRTTNNTNTDIISTFNRLETLLSSVTTQPTVDTALYSPPPLSLQSDHQITSSHSIESSPKRPRLDRSSKKDNQKTIKQSTNVSSSEASTASTIHCPICLETLDEIKLNNKRLKATTCGHVLCNVCLDATFRSNSDGVGHAKSILCPTCRNKLTKTKVHDLYL